MKMKQIIMIKYGELTTKKENIQYFIRTLNQNIKEKLKDFSVTTHFEAAYLLKPQKKIICSSSKN